MATSKSRGEQPAPDTGKLLQDYCEKKRIRKNALARVIGRNISTLVKFLKNDTIQSSALWDICFALNHNFFQDIACQLPAEFTSDAPVDLTAAERIAELEQEVKILQAERKVLLKAIKG